ELDDAEDRAALQRGAGLAQAFVGLAVVVDGKALGGPDVAGRRAPPPREDVARHLVDLHDSPARRIVARDHPPHSKRHGSAFERDVQVAVLLLEPILLEPLLRVAQRRSRLEIELPHVLHAGQGRPVVYALLVAHLVGPSNAGAVAKPLEGPAPQDVRGQDLLEVGFLDPAVPDVVGIDHDHGAVTTLGEAAGLVDAYGALFARLTSSVPEDLHETLGVALGRAGFTARADEHVTLVLAHRS